MCGMLSRKAVNEKVLIAMFGKCLENSIFTCFSPMVTTARSPVNKRCNGFCCVWCLPFHITLFCFRSGEEGGVQHAPRTGSDDPESSRRDLLARHKRCLESAGAKVKESVEIDISPLVSLRVPKARFSPNRLLSRSGSWMPWFDVEFGNGIEITDGLVHYVRTRACTISFIN